MRAVEPSNSRFRRRGRLDRAGARVVAVGDRAPVTRRGLQIALGFLWLLDGALQLQPFMLRASFARQVLDPSSDGQPHFVAGPAHWAANLIAAHPVVWDIPFATTQLLLGIGMLFPRTARLALFASVPYALGVWFFGEGLSGLASGNASLLSGAPGAVLLYAVIALAARPRNGRSDLPAAAWLRGAWATAWIGAALLQALPKNNDGADVASAMLANGSPSWLSRFETSSGVWTSRHGALVVMTLVAVEAVIGLTILYDRTLTLGVAAGFAGALAIWILTQNLGALYTGQATDPNTAPLIALMALALLGGVRRPLRVARARPHRTTAATS